MGERELFPKEVISNVPRVTLTGDERLHIEQHAGLIGYQADQVTFRTAQGMLRVEGDSLYFRLYTASEAVIGGNITGVVLETGGGRR